MDEKTSPIRIRTREWAEEQKQEWRREKIKKWRKSEREEQEL